MIPPSQWWHSHDSTCTVVVAIGIPPADDETSHIHQDILYTVTFQMQEDKEHVIYDQYQMTLAPIKQ